MHRVSPGEQICWPCQQSKKERTLPSLDFDTMTLLDDSRRPSESSRRSAQKAWVEL